MKKIFGIKKFRIGIFFVSVKNITLFIFGSLNFIFLETTFKKINDVL